MATESIHQQLLIQVTEQTEALEDLAAILAVASTAELVQVLQSVQPMRHLDTAWSRSARRTLIPFCFV